MLSKLFALHLSITQWLAVTLSSVIGLLVVTLKIQGSQLHKAQIQLLEATINQADTGKEAAVTIAKAKLQEALKAYHASKN